MKLVYFRRLKSAVGHDYVNENEVFQLKHYQSPTNKDKFTLDKIWNWLKQRYKNDSGWPRDDPAASSASEHNSGDRETTPDQGWSVIPDGVAIHEEIRPETHLLVRTEVSRLIE